MKSVHRVLGMNPPNAVSIASILIVAVGISVIKLLRTRRTSLNQDIARHQSRRLAARHFASMVDVGECFGIDIGGTLAKLIFFEPDFPQATRKETVNIISKFISSSTTYGQFGRRDAHLAFHLPELGGTFQFIRLDDYSLLG